MASLLWLRVFLPLAVLCLSGCLSEENLNQDAMEDDPQGDLAATSVPQPEHHKQSCHYEDDHRFTPIVQRDAWEKKRSELHPDWPLNYIVFRDGGKRCKTQEECLVSISSEMKRTTIEVCSTLDNFYVGGDGEVYEGRGWRVSPYWHLNGMRRKAVTVKFLGGHESEPPSERAMRAFWRMVTSGVWVANLSPGYKVVSMGQVYNDTTLVGKALEKAFQDSGVGQKEFSLVDTWETTPDKSLPLVTRIEWGAKKPTKPMTKMGHTQKYVMINEGGERCFTPEECMSRIKAEQEQQLPIYGDLADNFYIGDDGYVYEGRGFSYKPLWDTEIEMEDNRYMKDESLTVRFFGSFHSDRPSDKALGAFKLLVKATNSIHKLPGDYKIYSLRGIYNDSRFLGDEFFEIARKWTPWATELDDRFENEQRIDKGFIGMIKRIDWKAKHPEKVYGKIDHPVEYVMINENSRYDRCFSSKECLSVMKEIQEKDYKRYGDVVGNFYISENGIAYEGRGWDTEPQLQPCYFNKSLITVNFIGNHTGFGASLTALAAFDNLIQIGVKLGKIAPNYRFYSFRNVYDSDTFLGDDLKKYFEKNERWSKKLDTLSENERFNAGLLPIIPHSEWSDTSLEVARHPYTEAIRYVVVGSTGDHCFTHEECATEMKNLMKSSENDLSGNFYVADDGIAYEGRGWKFAPSMYSKGFKFEFYFVTFLGKYEDDNSTSNLPILAFKRLMENGLRTQKLSPDYKIIFTHQIFDSGDISTRHLYKAMKTWDRLISDISELVDIETSPSVNNIFVRRADWETEVHQVSIPKINLPAKYIVVHNVGEHCSDLTSCIRSLRTIQENTPAKYKDLADNFYVGDDGHIYEGRGWDHSSLWATKGIENKFISIGFLGTSETIAPSPKALLAFLILQNFGIINGVLTPDCKYISLSEILKENVVVTEKLVGALRETEQWSDDFGLKHDAARLRSLHSPFVLFEEWNLSEKPIRSGNELAKPVQYVAVRDGGAACATNVTCMMRINKEHEDRHTSSENGVGENFYVGNDGSVYEGTGWNLDSVWAFPGWQKTVTVQFLGNYENKLPSANALEAFIAVIIRDGLETGKLSPEYKIVPIPEGDGRTLGRKLREEIKTWKHAAEEIEN